MQGSVEAIIAALDKLGTDEVAARIVHSGVGGITECDVTLAATSGARDHRLQRPRQSAGARTPPKQAGIEIRYYNIIYNLVDDVKAAMSGLLVAGAPRDLPRQCRDPRGLRHHQGRQDRRLPRHRRQASSAVRVSA